MGLYTHAKKHPVYNVVIVDELELFLGCAVGWTLPLQGKTYNLHKNQLNVRYN